MGKLIRLETRVACDDPSQLSSGQRAALVTYKDAAACKEDYEYSARRYADVCPDLYEYAPVCEEPYAILACEVRGYAVYHNPREEGLFIQNCSDKDRAIIVDALGDDTKWYIVRYGSKNMRTLVRGFE